MRIEILPRADGIVELWMRDEYASKGITTTREGLDLLEEGIAAWKARGRPHEACMIQYGDEPPPTTATPVGG